MLPLQCSVTVKWLEAQDLDCQGLGCCSFKDPVVWRRVSALGERFSALSHVHCCLLSPLKLLKAHSSAAGWLKDPLLPLFDFWLSGRFGFSSLFLPKVLLPLSQCPQAPNSISWFWPAHTSLCNAVVSAYTHQTGGGTSPAGYNTIW